MKKYCHAGIEIGDAALPVVRCRARGWLVIAIHFSRSRMINSV